VRTVTQTIKIKNTQIRIKITVETKGNMACRLMGSQKVEKGQCEPKPCWKKTNKKHNFLHKCNEALQGIRYWDERWHASGDATEKSEENWGVGERVEERRGHGETMFPWN